MGEIIRLTSVYLVLCQPDEGQAAAVDLREIGKHIAEMGPSIYLMGGAWLVCTRKDPPAITGDLSRVNRKYKYIAIHVKGRATYDQTCSQYAGIAGIREWIEEYLLEPSSSSPQE